MISRRELLKFSGLAAVSSSLPGVAQELAPPDYRLEISSVTLELSARHKLRTTAYNGQAPGPLLRLKEGREVTIEVTNRSDRPEVVHWHGLFVAPEVDGAMEEGTPAIAVNATARYTFTPRPAGFRWYHTHTAAMDDLTRAQYGGQHGFLLVAPASDPGRYDQEHFLALHDWAGYLVANEDGAMSPSYAVSTINGKAMGFGEPLRVREGQRILLHILNSSPTEAHWLALAGHDLRIIALDGNVIPTPRTVSMLRLAPAERVCAIVEMNNPGVWILGEVRKHVQAAGMAIAVEYAGRTGRPRWQQPNELVWNYEQFADTPTDRAVTSSSGQAHTSEGGAARATGTSGGAPMTIPLIFESRFRGHGAMEGYLINGRSYPAAAVAPLQRGQRYRLRFINRTMDDHPLHLHRHTFEVRSVGVPLGARDAPGNTLAGLRKDVLLVDAYTQAEVDFTADNPGATLLHCHQQNHMDRGFMLLLNYA